MPDALRRLCATTSALVVFMLGLMSASPALHDWAHSQPYHETTEHSHEQESPPTSDSDHSCAIVSFSTGVAVPLDTALPVALPTTERQTHLTVGEALRLISPHFRLPPGRGPPVSLS